jgi:small-conductance mechanosensitive channel
MKYLRLLAILGPILACSGVEAATSKEIKKLQKSNESRKKAIDQLRQDIEIFRRELISANQKMDAVNNYATQLVYVLNQLTEMQERIDFIEIFLDLESITHDGKKCPDEKEEVKIKIPCMSSK